MSRASYNSWSDKHRVDDAAARNLSLAQTLSESIGRQKSQASREQQLGISPPPAKYQSSAEAAADVGHANQQAISTLETFMYPKDAHNAFGDLLKHDQIAEFNQYSGQFKTVIGAKKLSYIEFINLWNQFIDYLTGDRANKALYLTPEEKAEYDQNLKMNELISTTLMPHPPSYPFPIKSSEQKHPEQEMLLIEDAPKIDYTKLSRKLVEGKKENDINSISALLNLHTRFRKVLPANLIKAKSTGEISNANGANRRHNVQLLKESLLELDTTDHPIGEGFRRARIHGRGISPNLTKEQAIHRFKICQGEVLAGNDNPQLLHETRELITKLTKEGYLKYTNK